LSSLAYDAMKTYGGVEIQLRAFLTSVLDGDDWSASRPDRFIPRVKASGCYSIVKEVLTSLERISVGVWNFSELKRGEWVRSPEDVLNSRIIKYTLRKIPFNCVKQGGQIIQFEVLYAPGTALGCEFTLYSHQCNLIR